MEIFYQISWSRDRFGHECDSVKVANGSLQKGERALKCQYGCSDTITS